MRLTSTVALALLLSALGSACGGEPGVRIKAVRDERRAPANVEVSDEAFAGAVRDLMTTDPDNAERRTRLDGVLARQMSRASSRYARKDDKDRSLAAVIGGLSLVRLGELDKASLGPMGNGALTSAVRDLAGRGDEGRSRALYEILLRLAPPADQPDIQSHLDAIATWTKAGNDPTQPVSSLALLQRQAMQRRLLEPSAQAVEDAVAATAAWIEAAKRLQVALKFDRTAQPSYSERREAWQALQGGSTSIVALYLRDGQAAAALATLDRLRLREWVRPQGLVGALEEVKNKPSADSWMAVARALTPRTDEGRPVDDEDNPGIDGDLSSAAIFGCATEAYRHDPTSIEAAGVLADALQQLGMAEASPAILADAAKVHPDANTLHIALGLSMRSIALEADADDADAARRAYVATLPILAAADKALVKSDDSSPARVRALMGDIELREGRLTEARALLTSAANAEPSGRVLLALARIDQHDNDAPGALAHLKAALAAPDTNKDPALRGDVLLGVSEIAQSQGDAAGAKGPLEDALRGLTQARGRVTATERARVERTLARVLDRFGLDQAAARALNRALDAAPNDKGQASQTLTQFVARAFVRGDLAAARDGFGRAGAVDLPNDDLVYVALWVRLLERQLKAKAEPGPERLLASISDDGRWIGRIAAFGAGKIKAEDLVSSAKTPAQKTEALFYSAMDRRVAGDAKAVTDGLKLVTASAGVELVETAMARDLLGGNKTNYGPPPAGVSIP